MDHDEYRPDPAQGLRFADFRAARERFQARLALQADLARLERALTPVVPEEAPVGRPGGGGRMATGRGPDRGDPPTRGRT